MTDQILHRDTIFALSSGALPSGIAVVRLSGPATRDTLEAMTGGTPHPRKAKLADIWHGDVLLDRGLCLFFPAPASFTGEDCAELHLHGGRAVVSAVVDALSSIPSLRSAEPGEFTKRAFLNGKMDLTHAEALSDLIAAETEAQRRFALENSSEAHKNLYAGWRAQIIRARAMVEAELDFADEADVPGAIAGTIWEDVRALRESIIAHAALYRNSEIIRNGFKVVILGAPNAGKSSLLNALARREVAIVTDEPGTTRDVLEVSLDLSGMKVIIADTAGIREAQGRAEAIGVERSLQRAHDADLLLLVEDSSGPVPFQGIPEKPALKVGNKVDLLRDRASVSGYDCLVSAQTGEGLDFLLERISASAEASSGRSELLPFRSRHVVLLREAAEALGRALENEQELELRAESLRLASASMGRIHGEVDVEDLLDAIFTTFCIGK